MTIFNSLGSNYSLSLVIKSIFSFNKTNQQLILTSRLQKKFSGQTVLTYKAREALYLALKDAALPKNSTVAVCGFTCLTVIEAIEKAGYHPVFIDSDGDDLNFSPKNLEKEIKKDKFIKAVIIQNTLGYPADIKNISDICQKNKLILIEDLAHSVGTSYKNNKPAGIIGDYVVLSFSQDKIIDGVSGGALIKRKDKISVTYGKLPRKIMLINYIYPLLTFLIRKSYSWQLGKMIHFTAKKFRLLANPIYQPSGAIHKPLWFSCYLANQQLDNFDQQIKHRRKISHIYCQSLDKSVINEEICNIISYSTNIRFPIFISDRFSLIKYLAKNGVYISDIWYDAPVAPKKYAKEYQNINCPKFKKISTTILNLPTHINILDRNALEIVKLINQWIKLNSDK